MSDAKEKPNEAAPEKTGGGIKAFLPLILTVITMPVLAWAMTTFVLVPKLQSALAGGEVVHSREAQAGEHGKSGGHGGKEGHGAKAESRTRYKAKLERIVVNVSGSLGTRLLLASFTLVGHTSDFKDLVQENSDLLRDLAAATLSTKTIVDLEKPEARNLIRAELLTQFNQALGDGTVDEIYITEFAIQ